MGKHDHLGALVGQFADRRRLPFDAHHVGHASVFHRHVQIRAHQHALALHGKAIKRLKRIHGRSDQLAHRDSGIRHAIGEAPFVVVPAHDLNEIPVHHLGLIERERA